MSCIDDHDQTSSLFVHGTAVRVLDKGVLLLGPSTSGKSDLALRLMDAGATLIADDQVRLAVEGDRLFASPPARLKGLIELRGIGIMRVASADRTRLDLAVDLGPAAGDEPLPEPEAASWLGVTLPRIRLDARAASAAARIRLFLRSERVF